MLFLAFILVVCIHQGNVWVMVWNFAPIILCVLLIIFKDGSSQIVACTIHLIITIIGLGQILWHFVWLIDFGGVASGSSTSAIGHLFVPVWLVLISIGIGIAAWIVHKVQTK